MILGWQGRKGGRYLVLWDKKIWKQLSTHEIPLKKYTKIVLNNSSGLIPPYSIARGGPGRT